LVQAAQAAQASVQLALVLVQVVLAPLASVQLASALALLVSVLLVRGHTCTCLEGSTVGTNCNSFDTMRQLSLRV
jgi:hypothetical protein